MITIPTAKITNATNTVNNTCTEINPNTLIPVGGVNVTTSVALWSLSYNDVVNSPSFGSALPGIAIISLLPTSFSNLTTSAKLSNDKSSASFSEEIVLVTYKSICVL